jgi:signal transduction histidine kinase
MMDKDALDQMITNLLVNAFRYGGPNVFIDAQRERDEVLVRVRDDGEGVPDELVARLFEPFTRGPSSVKIGGSGLGLALVKSLSEATGATIAYERDDGFTSFVLRMAAAG